VAQIVVGAPTPATTAALLRTRVLSVCRRAHHPLRAVRQQKLTDNGPEWGGVFRTACHELGIEARRTKPGHAWTNGFVKRLQGTILREHWRVVFRQTYFTQAAQLERSLQRYLRCYNYDRTHRGLSAAGPHPGPDL